VAPKKTFLTKDEIDQFKKHYDPDLVDTLLTRAEDLDFRAAFGHAMTKLIKQANGETPFDRLAISRRTQEVELIKQEVRMFEQMGNLMTQISTQYSNLTGVPTPVTKRGE
jgi:hypothetical protein